jgi:ParB/RepB/Spo0J family partition protein
MSATAVTTLRDLPLADITESTWNPRKHFDPIKLDELARSIEEKGVIEPIVVRPVSLKATSKGDAPRFEIVAGARRFRGATMAKLEVIPAIVRELDDVAALELAVIENDQRDDVNAMEAAEGYQALITAGKGYTPASIATKLGKHESYVVRRLKLNGLEATFKDALREGRLSLGHGEKLLRLSPAQRTDALKRDVIWRHNPLLESFEKWIPQADDLQPLHKLEGFIREKSHFNPSDVGSAHLVPAFAQQLELRNVTVADLAERDDEDIDDAPAASLVELTLDSMARMRMGAKPNDPIPLTPSKWKEIKSEKGRCEFALRGVITQGTERYGAILEVCTKKSCKKHWPVAKRSKASAGKPKAAAPKAESWEEKQRREDEQRARKKSVSTAILAAALPSLVKHTAATKLSAALVRFVLDDYDIKQVQKTFGVALTDATAAQVLLLQSVDASPSWEGDIKGFRDDCMTLKFKLEPIEAKVKTELAAAAKTEKKPAKKAVA